MKDVDTGIAQYLTFNVNITSGFPFYASEAVEFLAMIFYYCTNTAPANKKVMIYVKSALMFKIIRKQIIVLMVLKKP